MCFEVKGLRANAREVRISRPSLNLKAVHFAREGCACASQAKRKESHAMTFDFDEAAARIAADPFDRVLFDRLGRKRVHPTPSSG
jgi:hypothetical protein